MTGKWQIDFTVINPRDKASSYSLFPFILSRKEQNAFHRRVSISSRHFYPLIQSYMCGVMQGCLQWCFSQKIELEQETWSSQAVSSAIWWKVRRNLWKKAQQIQTGPLEVSAAPLARRSGETTRRHFVNPWPQVGAWLLLSPRVVQWLGSLEAASIQLAPHLRVAKRKI